MSTESEIKQFIDRVLRLKEEQDTLSDDIREVYAEAKGRGYDKTAMGQVVAHIRKVDKLGSDAIAERETIFGMYLGAYETGTSVATHTHEAKFGNSYAAEQGIDPKLAHTIVTGMQTETGRAALIAAVDIMIEREEQIDPDTGEIKESLAEWPSDAVSERTATLVDATASAEAVREGQPSMTAATSAASAADERNVEATVEQRSSATQFEPPAFLQPKPLKTARDYRPHCQKPDACGASGLQHCYSCSKLIPEKSEVA